MTALETPSAPRWLVAERDPAAEERLVRELGIPGLVAALLAQRGHGDPAQAHAFLNPRLEDLADPSLLPDYAAARDAILGARERKERIYVHGDYDVDGITSAALLTRFLKSIGCQVTPHVPHRMREGYGIHESAVAAAAATGAKLFLTCDCGISAHEQVRMAREAGMTVVVTDHHSVGETIPDAAAVVNPHRIGSPYPFPELSGAGVAFRLCEGLTRDLGFPVERYRNAFLDLAALGTIADVMPLEGENRIIARYGLERLPETKKVGLRALMREAKIDAAAGRALRAYHVSFMLGPRLNAAGRIDDAAKALRLLLTTDDAEAAALAREIEEVNRERREEQSRMIEQATEKVMAADLHRRNVIVVCDEGWHTGIVGIVAGRLVQQFNRPCFVLSIDPATGVCKGSGRSVPKFSLFDAIEAHRPLFLSGGGHAMAAGCSFELGKLDEVVDSLHTFAGQFLTEEDFVPVVQADLEVEPAEVTLAAAGALCAMEPFGCANPEPIFLARGMTLAQVSPTRKPEHAKLLLTRGAARAAEGIAFNIGERLVEAGAGTVADVLFQPGIDEWNGARRLKWQVRDFRIA
jgi:single-stranded-DNA-specific exonuclease